MPCQHSGGGEKPTGGRSPLSINPHPTFGIGEALFNRTAPLAPPNNRLFSQRPGAGTFSFFVKFLSLFPTARVLLDVR